MPEEWIWPLESVSHPEKQKYCKGKVSEAEKTKRLKCPKKAIKHSGTSVERETNCHF